jgi:hypothetical protein
MLEVEQITQWIENGTVNKQTGQALIQKAMQGSFNGVNSATYNLNRQREQQRGRQNNVGNKK